MGPACATPGSNPGDGAQTGASVAIGAGKSSCWRRPVLSHCMWPRGQCADGRVRAGLFSNLVVWCSLVSVKTTGGGLPAGPFGFLGATQMYRAELGCISHPYVHLCIYSHACKDTRTDAHASTHFSIMKGTISIRTPRTPTTDTRTHTNARTHSHTTLQGPWRVSLILSSSALC